MNLELIPIVLGALVALAGAALIVDGLSSDTTASGTERRRAARAERHRGGEVAVGVGVALGGAAMIGRDLWRYGTVALLAGAVLVAVGALLNRRYLAARLGNRGVARRGRTWERRTVGTVAPPEPGAPRRPHDRRHAERRDAR